MGLVVVIFRIVTIGVIEQIHDRLALTTQLGKSQKRFVMSSKIRNLKFALRQPTDEARMV